MKRFKPLLAGAVGIVMTCFASLLLIGSVHAQPLYVSASSAQYMTYVEVLQVTNTSGDTGNIVSRTTTSPTPISDEIDLPVIAGQGEGMGIITHAIANANSFTDSDQTGWGFANAEAVSQISFSPLVDQTQNLNISVYALGAGLGTRNYTAGQITLLDLTLNSELWNYSWNVYGPDWVPVPVPSGDNIPWDSDGYTANFSFDTDFFASDQYELTMITCSDAGDDSESVQIQLTGLQVVPEPSTAAFLALCGISLAIYNIRSRSRVRQQT